MNNTFSLLSLSTCTSILIHVSKTKKRVKWLMWHGPVIFFYRKFGMFFWKYHDIFVYYVNFNVPYLAIGITFTLIQYIIRYHDKGSIINSNEHAHTFTGAQGSIFFWFILHVLQWKTNRKETDVLQCAHDSKNSVITILTFAWPRLTVREVRLTQDVKTFFWV